MGPSRLLAYYGTEFLGTLPITTTSLDEKIRLFTPGLRMHTLLPHSTSIPEHVVKRLESGFSEEKNICIYVHQNTYRPDPPHPVFCLIYIDWKEKVLVIGRKIRRGNFQNTKTRDVFLAITYSRENELRLAQINLSMHPIEYYDSY